MNYTIFTEKSKITFLLKNYNFNTYR